MLGDGVLDCWSLLTFVPNEMQWKMLPEGFHSHLDVIENNILVAVFPATTVLV